MYENKTAHIYIAETIDGELRESIEGKPLWVDLSSFNVNKDMAYEWHRKFFKLYFSIIYKKS